MACHRLARLVGQGPFVVDPLVAYAIEGMATYGDAVLADAGKLTAEQAQRFAADFRRLPPMEKLADKIDWAERLFYLDGVHLAAKEGPSPLLSGWNILGGEKDHWAWLTNRLAKAMVDWNEPLRMGNAWNDRVVAAFSKRTHKERAAAVADSQRDIKQMSAEATDVRAIVRRTLSSGSLRFALSRMMGQLLVSEFAAAIGAMMTAEERNAAYREMLPVLFALSAFRTDHGSYPAELAALVPKYLPAVPEELFSGGPLHYKREAAGYVLYAVGPNGKDDGGRSAMDMPYAEENRDFDDIAIHAPAKQE